MKNVVLPLAIAFLLCNLANAQAPQSIPYQAVARNAAGNLLVNQHICVQFGIYTVISGGSPVYQEHQTVTTNSLGLFTINVGTGGTITAGSNLGAIGWGSNSALFMQVDIDLTSSCSGYTSLGRTQMMSVPYALYAGSSSPAGSAGGDLSGSYPAPTVSAIQGRAISSTIPTAGQILQYNGGSSSWVPANAGSSLFTAGTGLGWSGSTLNNTGVTSVATNNGLTGGTITTTGTIGIATGGVTNAMLANASVNYPVGSGLTGGGSVSLGGTATTIGIATAGITNAMLANPSLTVTAGTGLGGGGAVSLGGSVTLTNAGVTSLTAGTGILLSASTGGVTITNSAAIPTGTNGQTLYNNAGTWTSTSNLYNNGTNVGFGGNTTPSYPVDVTGTARATEFIGAGQCYEKWGSWGCSSGYNEVLDGRTGGQESFETGGGTTYGMQNVVCVSSTPTPTVSYTTTYSNRLMRATSSANSMDRVQPRCAICCKGGCYTAFGVNSCATGYTAMYTGRIGGVEAFTGSQYYQKTLCIDGSATVEKTSASYGTTYSTRLMRHREDATSGDTNGMDQVTNICAVCCRQ